MLDSIVAGSLVALAGIWSVARLARKASASRHQRAGMGCGAGCGACVCQPAPLGPGASPAGRVAP